MSYLLAGAGCGAGAAVLAYQLFDHVKRRVAAWSNPWADVDNTGYQITQSLFGHRHGRLVRGWGLSPEGLAGR